MTATAASETGNGMQTILGAGGPIGLELAQMLGEYTERVRLVSRNPKKVLPGNEVFPADLLDAAQVTRAVEGSTTAYLVAGLPYRTKVWRACWPIVMRNVIQACRSTGAGLVFFDNVYMYDRDRLASMDENTPVRPTSGKGSVRAGIAGMLMDAVERGEVEALIARCADFYGPGRQKNSVLTQTVFERLAAGKPAQWLLSADYPHSFTYTPDAARGTAMLGNAKDAYGQIWHLPTAAPALTGRQWVEAIADALGVEPGIQVATRGLLAILGFVMPTMREVREMAYQYDRDYVFRSDKFNARFGFEPTPQERGIAAVVAADYR